MPTTTAPPDSCNTGSSSRGTDQLDHFPGSPQEEQLTEVNNLLLLGQPLKTKAARRTVAIPRFLAEIVDEYLGRLEALREQRGLGPVGSDDVVFVNPWGGLLRRGGFRTNYWLPALRKAGLEGVRVHDLRHTAVAFAINLTDAHPKAVQVRFGHSSIQQTYDRYGHLFPQMDVSIADASTTPGNRRGPRLRTGPPS